MSRAIVLVSFLAIASACSAHSQELNCTVTVNTDNLQSDQQSYLANFASDVERYLNDNSWTNEDFGGEKIDCSLTIFFLTATGDGQYSARVVVVSQRPIYVGSDESGRDTQVLRIADEKWNFHYVPGQPMIKDETVFDPLTDVLDFYAHLIIGMDAETYSELAGSDDFQKASDICAQATTSSSADDWQSAEGIYSRSRYVGELMDAGYQPFRLAFTLYHSDGLDLLGTDRQAGLENMLKAIESMAKLRDEQSPLSLLDRIFFESKYVEIADVFRSWPDKSVYDRLTAADPSHESTYDAYRK